jgi:hypothetical protein
MRINLDRTVKVGDLLTSVSVLVSIVALLIAWSKDIQLRRSEQANKVRGAAAETLAKLERWQEISLFSFDEVQPSFITTSEMLLKSFDINQARDYLYKSLTDTRRRTKQLHIEENIEAAYVAIYGYYPAIRPQLSETLRTAKKAEDAMFDAMLLSTQSDILSLDDLKDRYETAMLGNMLRETAIDQKTKYQDELTQIMTPMTSVLLDVMRSTDRNLLNYSNIEYTSLVNASYAWVLSPSSFIDWVFLSGTGGRSEILPEWPNERALRYLPEAKRLHTRRFGDEVRGAAGCGAHTLTVLAPPYSGVTMQSQPTLYWFLGSAVGAPIEIELYGVDSVDPLMTASYPGGLAAGIHGLSLAEHDVEIELGTQFQWVVAVICDPDDPAADAVSVGQILRLSPLPDLASRLRIETQQEQAKTLVEFGIWYDALEALATLIAEQPRDRRWRMERGRLLEQVGLFEAARHDMEDSLRR